MLLLSLVPRGGLFPYVMFLAQSPVGCGERSECCLTGSGSHASSKGEGIPLEGTGGGGVEAWSWDNIEFGEVLIFYLSVSGPVMQPDNLYCDCTT